jgi:signal transduction histidine kinase
VVGNGLQYNFPERPGRCPCTAAGGAILTVTNSGPLVPADQIARLFQPFQWLDTKLGRQNGGPGLGLSIAGAIATAHDACLTAQPGPAGGLAVLVSFPALAASQGTRAFPTSDR